MRVRIKEAREAYEERTGERMTIARLAITIWPECNEDRTILSKMDKLNRMQSGRTGKNPDLEVIQQIALICGVDYNFLILGT